jgi:hypothetical protein
MVIFDNENGREHVNLELSIDRPNTPRAFIDHNPVNNLAARIEKIGLETPFLFGHFRHDHLLSGEILCKLFPGIVYGGDWAAGAVPVTFALAAPATLFQVALSIATGLATFTILVLTTSRICGHGRTY